MKVICKRMLVSVLGPFLPLTICAGPLVETPLAEKCQENAEIRWTRPICVEEGRYIGWPTVCRLSNGDILAVFSGDRDGHICPYGKVQMIRSADDGETWSKPVTLVDGPIDDRDAGIVQLPNGEIVVTYFTSVAYRQRPSLKEKASEYAQYDRAHPCDEQREIGYFRLSSTDGGRTWTKPQKMEKVSHAPHGPALLKDGSLLMLGRGYADGTPTGGYTDSRSVISAWRSTDGARTWECLCPDIPDEDGECLKPNLFHEPHVVELPDGTLVGQIRYHGRDQALYQTVSKDGGKTWSPMRKSGLVGFPSHLLNLKDGRLVSVYSRRLESAGIGEFAAISSDGGKSWDARNEICLLPGVKPTRDFGYPASCELPNGDILTVYYQPKVAGEKPCLIASKWRPRGFAKADKARRTPALAGVVGVRGTFSPDGRKIAFQRAAGGDVRLGVLNLDDGRIKWVERSEGQAAFPFWAKDGRLVYSFGKVDAAVRKEGRNRSEGFGIRIREGESVRTFPHGRWFEESPSMPDDGSCVWYASTKGIKHYDTCKQYPGEGFRAVIVRRDLADDRVTAVYAVSNSLMCGVRSPQVSPDGTQVAWSQLDAFRKSEMHVRVAATNDLRAATVVSPSDMTAYGPKWSADGRFLCFTGFRAGDPGWSVYLARLSDGSVRRLCTGENPAFSPDGRRIVYDDGAELHLWDVAAGCELPLAVREKTPFRVLALVDSGDFDSVYDVSTAAGNLQILDHVMTTGPTDVLWRDKGGGVPRYDSREDPIADARCFFDTRRLLNQSISSFAGISVGGSETFRVVARGCAERGVAFGIHTTYEENHRWPDSESPWNLRHPQFACRTRGGKPRTDTCSLAYPEVMAHKLKLVDERLALGPKTIFLDCCETRMGAWTPEREYVRPMCEKWAKLHGGEPPEDWKDPRWTALVAENVSRYLRAFGAKCHAAGIEFLVGVSPVDDGDDFVYRQWAIDWKKLAAEGTFDGVVAMGVKVDEEDPFGSTRRILAKTRESIGKAALYFQCSAYDFNFGYAMYARKLKIGYGTAAKRLIEITKEVGGKGVILECVDYKNYPDDVRAVLKNAKVK